MDNGNAPSTKADLAELKSELADLLKTSLAGVALKSDLAGVALKSDLAMVEQRLDEKIEIRRSEATRAYNDLRERIGDFGTNILKAIDDLAKSYELRFSQIETGHAEIGNRLDTLETRLTAAEYAAAPPKAA
jgi:hypothetical protein